MAIDLMPIDGGGRTARWYRRPSFIVLAALALVVGGLALAVTPDDERELAAAPGVDGLSVRTAAEAPEHDHADGEHAGDHADGAHDDADGHAHDDADGHAHDAADGHAHDAATRGEHAHDGTAGGEHAHDPAATGDHAHTDPAAPPHEHPVDPTAPPHDHVPDPTAPPHDHVPDPTTPTVTPEQQARADALLAATKASIPKWSSTSAAYSSGFRSIGDGVTGFEHWVNWSWLGDGRTLDPNFPESLVYKVMPDGSRVLQSAMYILPLGATMADVPDVGGALTPWHLHDNLCWNLNTLQVVGFTVGGQCLVGTLFVTPPMLHVWIVDVPCGPFAEIENVQGTVACGEHAHTT